MQQVATRSRARLVARRLACAAGVAALVVLTTATARAEVRQVLISSERADADNAVLELTHALQEAGFQGAPVSDQTRSTGGTDAAATFRYLEYSYYHVDGRSITVTFLLLTAPDPDDLEMLSQHATTNYGWNTFRPMRDFGLLSWVEYSPMGGSGTQTLDTILVEWRETYLRTR